MFSHIMLGAKKLEDSRQFYDQVMPILGYQRVASGETFIGYGHAEDAATGVNCLWIGTPLNGEEAHPGNGVNIALSATSRGQVDDFYTSGLAFGGSDEGAPGIRPEIHPGFYAAYLRDPSGNKLVVVCHN